MTASSTPALASGRSPALSPIARLRAWYAACAPRERRMLVLAVAVVLSGALISTAEQLAAERKRLARGLPAARIAGDLVEVGGRATLPALVDWLATLHAEQRLRPTRLELQAAGTDGLARFDAMFEVGGQ